MEMPEYMICELPEETKGVNIVLHTEGPFPYGWVSQFRTEDELAAYKVNSSTPFAQVPGYRIIISYKGNLEPAAPRRVNLTTLLGMAEHYLKNKVLKNAGYFKRYKQEA